MRTGLTGRQLAAVLAVLLGVFLFAAGPVWRHPWEVDGAVWLSYAPIPLLVAGVLLATRRFAGAPTSSTCCR